MQRPRWIKENEMRREEHRCIRQGKKKVIRRATIAASTRNNVKCAAEPTYLAGYLALYKYSSAPMSIRSFPCQNQRDFPSEDSGIKPNHQRLAYVQNALPQLRQCNTQNSVTAFSSEKKKTFEEYKRGLTEMNNIQPMPHPSRAPTKKKKKKKKKILCCQENNPWKKEKRR